MNKNYKKIGIIFGLVFLTVILSNPLITSYRAQIDQGITPPPDPGSPPTLIQVVKPGDIIFFDYLPEYTNFEEDLFYTIKNFPGINSNDHCVLFVGTISGLDSNPPITDWCIHNGMTTSYKRLSEFQKTSTNFTAFRVKASSEQITRVIKWVQDRVADDCPYQLTYDNLKDYGGYPNVGFFDALTHIMTKNWDNVRTKGTLNNMFYCNELIWAAYYNAGIDIDHNGDSSVPYGVPTINMGIVVAYDWYYHGTLSSDDYNYAKLNEIKIDNDVYQVYPVFSPPGIALATND
jgi:hypothetical protein